MNSSPEISSMQPPIHPEKSALLIIDAQNDYFPDGAYPLWNTEACLDAIKSSVAHFQESQLPIILIQHIADPQLGLAPFFNSETEGAQIHPELLELLPTAPIVVKHYADSFHLTDLAKTLCEHEVTTLYLCGMMTQNCVTHTALSLSAQAYEVKVITDACTTVDEMLHVIALHALSTRVSLLGSAEL